MCGIPKEDASPSCLICDDGFEWNSKKKLCEADACSEALCDECIDEVCLFCVSGYGFSNKNFCSSCPEQCQTCLKSKDYQYYMEKLEGGPSVLLSSDQMGCIRCNPGSVLAPNGTCESCGGFCEMCSMSEGCKKCAPGFYLKKNKKECSKCEDKNCRECEFYQDGMSRCIECHDGFYIDPVKEQCEKCSKGCATCLDGEPAQCLSCENGKELLVSFNIFGIVTKRECADGCTASSVSHGYWINNTEAVACVKDSTISKALTFKGDHDGLTNSLTLTSWIPAVLLKGDKCQDDESRKHCSCNGEALWLDSNLTSFTCVCDPGFQGLFCEFPLADWEAIRMANREILHFVLDGAMINERIIETLQNVGLSPVDNMMIRRVLDKIERYGNKKEISAEVDMLIEAMSLLIIQAEANLLQDQFYMRDRRKLLVSNTIEMVNGSSILDDYFFSSGRLKYSDIFDDFGGNIFGENGWEYGLEGDSNDGSELQIKFSDIRMALKSIGFNFGSTHLAFSNQKEEIITAKGCSSSQNKCNLAISLVKGNSTETTNSSKKEQFFFSREKTSRYRLNSRET